MTTDSNTTKLGPGHDIDYTEIPPPCHVPMTIPEVVCMYLVHMYLLYCYTQVVVRGIIYEYE